MDFTKFIESGDMNGLKKYKDDGGDLNVISIYSLCRSKSYNYFMMFLFLYF